MHEMYERISIRNHKSFMPHAAIYKMTADILEVGDPWAYNLSPLELQNAETKRVATQSAPKNLTVRGPGERVGKGGIISKTIGYCTSMCIKTLQNMLSCRYLRMGDGIIATGFEGQRDRVWRAGSASDLTGCLRGGGGARRG